MKISMKLESFSVGPEDQLTMCVRSYVVFLGSIVVGF